MGQHSFERITRHVHWLSPDSTTDRPVLGAIAGERGTLIVDAGNSPAHAHTLLRELARANLPPPLFVALTHWHWDHVFGTAVLDLPTFAHVETQQAVREMSNLDWSDAALDQRVESGQEIAFCRDMIKAELPDRSELVLRPPDLAFSNEVSIDLGGVTCRLIHVGGDHSSDSVIVYVPEDRLVFLGDSIYVDIYHHKRRYTTQKLFPLLDRLLGYDAECYLAGHDPQPLTRAAMVSEAELLRTIGRAVEEDGGDRAALLAQVEQLLGVPMSEDHEELIDAFRAGKAAAAPPADPSDER